MGKQTGPRFTMAEMLAIFKAQSEGKSLDAASQEILGARATEEKFDAAAFQVNLDAFVLTLDRKEEAEYFVRAARLDPQFAKMVSEHQVNIAAIVKWAGANASRIKFYNSAHASIENGNRKHIDPLGANAIARKPIVHADDFKRGDGFVMIDNFADLLAQEKDVDALKWANALNKPGNIFHNKTLRALDLDLFNTADKGQNYGPGSKCRKWLKVYYKSEQAA